MTYATPSGTVSVRLEIVEFHDGEVSRQIASAMKDMPTEDAALLLACDRIAGWGVASVIVIRLRIFIDVRSAILGCELDDPTDWPEVRRALERDGWLVREEQP